MSTKGQHGEVPHRSELSRSAQKVSASQQQKKTSTGASAGCLKGFDRGLDEEMPQQGSETTNSPSKAEDFEMMTEENQIKTAEGIQIKKAEKNQIQMTEENQIQMAKENQIQTSSGPLGRVGKMMTEKNQIQTAEGNQIKMTEENLQPRFQKSWDKVQITAEGNQIQTSSVLGPLGRVGKMMTEANQIQTAEENQIKTTEGNQIQMNEGNQIKMTEENQIQLTEENKIRLSRDGKFVQASGINPASDELQMRTSTTRHRSNSFLNVLGMNLCQIRIAHHIQNWIKYQMIFRTCLMRITYQTLSQKMRTMKIQMQASPFCLIR
ncbi:uncharacterized protein LOC132898039 [Neoarius graeffei]|uniref:uncharacterized protein LOC132898039 n=1 Tax=Neoarius graeffei TaxID=443677 RepID=UPI00298CD050|nr:uncharacterized protein LOC132898039 [Neoarius graeffei]XP_060795388.1 uncharacterized protein LOC132898039 [Neoarius graeffei]